MKKLVPEVMRKKAKGADPLSFEYCFNLVSNRIAEFQGDQRKKVLDALRSNDPALKTEIRNGLQNSNTIIAFTQATGQLMMISDADECATAIVNLLSEVFDDELKVDSEVPRTTGPKL